MLGKRDLLATEPPVTHLALAEAHLRLFDILQSNSPNPMTLIDIRDAALNSEFSSVQALRAGLPTRWAIIGFIWSLLSIIPDRRFRSARYKVEPIFIWQKCAFQMKKRDYPSRLALRRRKSLAFRRRRGLRSRRRSYVGRRHASWLNLSKQGFRLRPQYQQELICNLVTNVPPNGIQAMIDFIVTELQPDLQGLKSLNGVCVKRLTEQLVPLCQYQALGPNSKPANDRTREPWDYGWKPKGYIHN